MRSLIYRSFCYLLIACLIVSGTMASGQQAYADNDADYITFLYETFPSKDSDTRIKYNYDANSVSGKMRLTPASSYKRGSVFNNEKVSLKDDRSFSTYFTFEITGSNGSCCSSSRGGDGIVFTVQTHDNSAASSGGTLGYFDIKQSVAVKFDTWRNSEHGDSSDNSVAIMQNGVINNLLSKADLDKSTLDLMTGTIHVWVDYDGPQGIIEVRLSKNSNTRPEDPVLSHTFDADKRLTSILNSDLAYVGFTAATGGAYQNHDITSWYFTNYYHPIDVENNDYKQAPSGYTLSTEDLDDGRAELSIQALGENTSGVPLTVSAADANAIVDSSTVTTDADGTAIVILSSSDNRTIETTVTVEGPGGVVATADVTIPGRTDAPLAENIAANATTKEVSVRGVPENATVTIYDHEDEVVAVKAGVTGGSVLFEEVDELSVSDPIKVTFRVSPQAESARTAVTPQELSSAPDAADVDANLITDTVTVDNVPKDATVIVYDDEGNVLGQKTNEGDEGAQIEIEDLELEADQVIHVVIVEDGKLESDPVIVTVTRPALAISTEVLADGTVELTIKTIGKHAAGIPFTVTVADPDAVATPSTVTTDADGEAIVILSSSDNATIESTVTVSGPAGLTESEDVTIPGRTDAPLAENIAANATTKEVSVRGVPENANVTIYDHEDEVVAVKTGVTGGSVLFEEVDELSVSDPIKVTFRVSPQVESARTAVTPKELSSAPDGADVDANIIKDTVTVDNVPKDATVIVYDDEGNVLGQKTNEGDEGAQIEVEDLELEADQVIHVVIVEDGKLESDPVILTVTKPTLTISTEELVDGTVELTIKTTGKHAAGIPFTVTVADPDAVATPSAVTTNADGEAVVILSSSDNATIESTVTVSGPAGLTETADVTIPGRTDAPLAENIAANAVTLKVSISGVPENATVTIYNHDDDVIAVKPGVTGGSVVFEEVDELSTSHPIRVTFHLEPQLESEQTEVYPYAHDSVSPSPSDILDIDVESGTITVDNVPPGAVVTIYDEDDQIIGQETNDGAVAGEVTVTVPEVPPVIKITITEPENKESSPTIIDVEQNTQEMIEEAIQDLEIGFQEDDTWESVTLPLFVVSVGKNNTSVHWTSSKPDIVEITDPVNDTIEALVHRQEKDVSVILTAEVSKNGVKRTRTFLVIVKALGLVKTIEAGQRQVSVTGGEEGQVSKPLDIDRIILTDGTRTVKIDKTIFDKAKADEFVNEAGTTGSVARIYVDSVENDEADEIAIEVPEETLATLFGNGNSLEVNSDYGSLSIANAVLGSMVDSFLDLFFRIVPVKDADQQSAINNDIAHDADVLAEANGRTIRVLGSSLEVETNYRDYATTLYIPFEKNGITVPAQGVAGFLDSLRIYIEHSDGTTSFVRGTVVNDGGGAPIGLSIEIDKFSVFTIVQLTNNYTWTVPDAQSPVERIIGFHAAYISGFAGGTFRPDQAITRAEMAAILSRNLTLTERYPYQQLFPDVSEAHWAASYIEHLKRAGLIVGDHRGKFNPNNQMTRAELATIVAKWLQLDTRTGAALPFSDVSGNHWAAGAIAAVYEAGIIVGFPDGTFGAERSVTRAEAVTIMNRLLGRTELAADEHQTWLDVPRSHWAFKAIEEASREHYYTVTAEGIEELVELEEIE